jgi:hypothetical protein
LSEAPFFIETYQEFLGKENLSQLRRNWHGRQEFLKQLMVRENDKRDTAQYVGTSFPFDNKVSK